MRKEMDDLEIDVLFIVKYGGTYKPMAYGTIQNRSRKTWKNNRYR